MQSSKTRLLAWIAAPILTGMPGLTGLSSLMGLTGPRPPTNAPQGSTAETLNAIQERIDAARELASSQENDTRMGNAARDRSERQLARAESALDRGDWLQSLRPYAAVADALAQSLVVFEPEPESLKELALESGALRDLLEELGSPLEHRAQRPAALQALLETASSTATAYLTSAGEQGREASLAAGIYYLKIARCQAELARFLMALPCEAPERPLGDVPGLSSYLDQLEAELLALYQPPLTQERHATFIGLSASLNFAREMHDQGHQLGALERGLQVARGIALFPENAPTADRAALRQELESWREELALRNTDVSLPAVWLAQAHAELEDESSRLADVPALFERVLSDYFACFEGEGADTGPIEPEVTVTLVRWPFT